MRTGLIRDAPGQVASAEFDAALQNFEAEQGFGALEGSRAGLGASLGASLDELVVENVGSLRQSRCAQAGCPSPRADHTAA